MKRVPLNLNLAAIVLISLISSTACAFSWPQQAGEASRDAFQVSNHFQVAQGLNSSSFSLTWTSEEEGSNTLVVDQNNAYWATGAGVVRAVALASGTLAWVSSTAGVSYGQVQLPQGIWNAPVLAGAYLVVPSEASLFVLNAASGLEVTRLDLEAPVQGPLALSGSETQPLLTLALANQQFGCLDLLASIQKGGPIWVSLVRLPGIVSYIPGGVSLGVSPGASAFLPFYNGGFQSWLFGTLALQQQFQVQIPAGGSGYRSWCVVESTDVFVSDRAGRVLRIDPVSGAVTASVVEPGDVEGLAYDRIGKHLLVAYSNTSGAGLAEYDNSLDQIWSDSYPGDSWMSQPLVLSTQVVDVLGGPTSSILQAVALDNSQQVSLPVPLPVQEGAGLAATDGRLVLAADPTDLVWWSETVPTPVLQGSWVNDGQGGSMVQLSWNRPPTGIRPFSFLLSREATGGGAFVTVTSTGQFSYNDDPAPSPGTYVYQLTLTDGNGVPATAQTTVQVGAGVPGTATISPTWTPRSTATSSPTVTPTYTASATATESETFTGTETSTTSSTMSASPTISPIPSISASPSATPSASTTWTVSPTPPSPTDTLTVTASPTSTPTSIPTPCPGWSNFALASNGGSVAFVNAAAAASLNDGDTWDSIYQGFPQPVTIAFPQSRSIQRVVVWLFGSPANFVVSAFDPITGIATPITGTWSQIITDPDQEELEMEFDFSPMWVDGLQIKLPANATLGMKEFDNLTEIEAWGCGVPPQPQVTPEFTPAPDCPANGDVDWALSQNGARGAGVLGDGDYADYAFTQSTSPYPADGSIYDVRLVAPRMIHRVVLFTTSQDNHGGASWIDRWTLEFQDPVTGLWNQIFDSGIQPTLTSHEGNYDAVINYWRQEAELPNVVAQNYRIQVINAAPTGKVKQLDEIQLWGCGDLAVTTATPTFTPAPACPDMTNFALPQTGASPAGALNDGDTVTAQSVIVPATIEINFSSPAEIQESQILVGGPLTQLSDPSSPGGILYQANPWYFTDYEVQYNKAPYGEPSYWVTAANHVTIDQPFYAVGPLFESDDSLKFPITAQNWRLVVHATTGGTGGIYEWRLLGCPNTAQPTQTTSNSSTITVVATSTQSVTVTMTRTSTNTPSATSTSTETSTPTFTDSATPTSTDTAIDTPTGTSTPSNTPTATPSDTPTETNTVTSTDSATSTDTDTATDTSTSTFTPSNTPTGTPSDTPTASNTVTSTDSATSTETGTATDTLSETSTSSNTPMATPSNTATDTATTSATSTETVTGTATASSTSTASGTGSRTITPTNSETPSNTSTRTWTPTRTATSTSTPTTTRTHSPSNTVTRTFTSSPTATLTPNGLPCLPAGLVGNTQGVIVNSGASVDSYRSSLGTYGGSNRFSGGNVQAAGAITVQAGGSINGFVSPDDPPMLTPNPTPSLYTNLGNLNISGNYTFAAGDYVVDTLNMNGSPNVLANGRVRIWFNNLNLAGTIGASSRLPAELSFYSLPNAGQVNINGGTTTLYGMIFAPNIPVTVNGTGAVYGALVGSSVDLNSSVSVHEDEDLLLDCGGTGGGEPALVRAVPKDAVPTTAPSGNSGLVAAPNPTSGITEIVVTLNRPAEVEISVFNLSGELVAKSDLGYQSAGIVRWTFNAGKLADGAYFVVARSISGAESRALGFFKLAVIR